MTRRMSVDQFRSYQAVKGSSIKKNPMEKMQALGRLKQGEMNNLEKEYADQLKMRQMAGEVAWFEFDCINLRLADNTFYKCDFFVMLADGQLEAHEVKGRWMDDARVKIKVAADKFPFKFIAITKKSGKFVVEEF